MRNSMKKVFAVIFGSILLMSRLVSTASAQESVMSIYPAVVLPGQAVTVTVSNTAGALASGVQLYLSYDASRFQLQSVAALGEDYQASGNPLTIALYGKSFSGSALASVTFVALEGAAGPATFTIGEGSYVLWDDLNESPILNPSLSVTISEPEPPPREPDPPVIVEPQPDPDPPVAPIEQPEAPVIVPQPEPESVPEPEPQATEQQTTEQQTTTEATTAATTTEKTTAATTAAATTAKATQTVRVSQTAEETKQAQMFKLGDDPDGGRNWWLIGGISLIGLSAFSLLTFMTIKGIQAKKQTDRKRMPGIRE